MKEIYKKAIVNVLFSIAVLLLILFLVPKVWTYFLPFLIAWVIAACASPIVHFLEKRIKLKRKMGSVLVIVAVIAAIVFLFYWILATLCGQLWGWIESLPDLLDQINGVLEEIVEQLVAVGILENGNLKNMTEQFGTQIITAISSFADGSSKLAISFVGNMANQVPMFLIGLFVCLISSYFFVAEKLEYEDAIRKMIPDSIQNNWRIFTQSTKKAFGGYMKAQVKIELWIYLILVIGLFILQVDYALFIAFIIAFLDFLPILGAGIVMIPWAVISLICGDYKLAVGLLIVWGLTQIFRQMIQPKYVGESVGIKPLPTLILLYFGYCIGGMAGLILAIPVGYVAINLYKAGLFDTTLESIKILVEGFNQYRKLEKKEQDEKSD